MSCMWGSTLAFSIVNSSLGLNTFLLDKLIVKKMSEIAFLTRQSLGYYGSWSLFSLSHHYIVWLAAKYAYPTSIAPFVDYTLLGDDILITDIKVAEQYRKLLDRLGVTISESKSIIFYNGTIEFVKRYCTKSMQVDLSPISLRSLLFCRTTLGLCNLSTKYSINISILQRLGGAGYRVRSRLYSTQSKRWERLKVVARKPGRSHPLPLKY
ncbi:putative NADH-ubiquinone oxidoreductase chain 4L-like [Capsicum annuum]|nr:putative NADH-ubiquinone oxidoreductase chain 4L-like [Capsicum annuum]